MLENRCEHVSNIGDFASIFDRRGFIGQTTEMIDGKKQTTYTWDAHSPQDCVKDLVTLCKDLRVGLQARFTNIVPTSVKKLCNVFDFEKIAKHMCNYKVKDGRLVIERDDRIQWETSSNNELHKFMSALCHMFKLLPTQITIWIFCRQIAMRY